MEITGTVHYLGAPITVSANYEKRELVVKTDEQYPQLIMIEFGQGKCNDKLDALLVGSPVTVGINLRGREWINPQGEAKYFNSISGWQVK
jgi:hypothetical protein